MPEESLQVRLELWGREETQEIGSFKNSMGFHWAVNGGLLSFWRILSNISWEKLEENFEGRVFKFLLEGGNSFCSSIARFVLLCGHVEHGVNGVGWFESSSNGNVFHRIADSTVQKRSENLASKQAPATSPLKTTKQITSNRYKYSTRRPWRRTTRKTESPPSLSHSRCLPKFLSFSLVI